MSEPEGTAPAARLRLHPFRAMRFNAETVTDVGEVTSPPYDVMDRAMIDELLSEHPNNIVRLILPRLVNEPLGSDDPYATAARRLERWRSRRLLVTDPTPALYVYEYGDAQHRVCGLVGALELRRRRERVILPHEDVIPAIVAERLAMLAAAEANLEPILLVYDGEPIASDIVGQVRREPPLTDVSAGDGTFHRLWSITDGERLHAIGKALSPHQALIADGHHRYATYLQLRRRHRAMGDGHGPWDRGLALLIDQSEFPLHLDAIHRSVSELGLKRLARVPGFRLGKSEPLLTSPPSPPDKVGEMILTDGVSRRRVTVTAERDHTVTDTAMLHEHLLPAWGVTDDRISYHHTVAQGLHSAGQEGGLAILLHPTSVAEVMAVSRAGKIMPRKSTSFGPKPRMGLVMRSFADDS